MPDQFDIQRKLDHASDNLVDEVMEELEESKEKAQERRARLIPLDENYYFDPQDKLVLLREGSQFHKLRHSPVYLRRSVERIEAEAQNQGFVPVDGGLFWNPGTKHLYVRNDDHYVLYTLDRRMRSW